MTATRSSRTLAPWAAYLLGSTLLFCPDARGQSPAKANPQGQGGATLDVDNDGLADLEVSGVQPLATQDYLRYYVNLTQSENPMGLELAPVDRSLRSQLKLPEDRGLVVVSVKPTGPADRVGLKANDILLTLADQALAAPEDLPARLKEAGDAPVVLSLIRDGKPTTLRVRPVYRVTLGPVEDERPEYFIGVSTAPVDATLRSHLKGLPEGQGVVVTEVVADSPAAAAGVKEGDILLRLGDADLSDFEALAAQVQVLGESPATLRLIRGGEPQDVAVAPRPRPQSLQIEAEVRDLESALELVGRTNQPNVTYYLPNQGNGAWIADLTGTNAMNNLTWSMQPQVQLDWQNAFKEWQQVDQKRNQEITAQIEALTRLEQQTQAALTRRSGPASDDLVPRLDALTEQVQSLSRSVEELRHTIAAEKADRPSRR